MADLVAFPLAPDIPPRIDSAAPDRLIEGTPEFRTWENFDAGAEGSWSKIRSGIWEATPGKTRSIKAGSFEYCHILSGRVRLSEEGGESREFGPGESFVLRPGFIGVWETLETARKIWVIAS